MIVVAWVMLAVGALAFLSRLLIGPQLPDRVVALDGLATTIIIGMIIGAVTTDAGFDIDIVLLVAVVGFVGAGVLARFVERRGG